jgi:hypothetical protein
VALPGGPVEGPKQLPHRCASSSSTDPPKNNDHDDTETPSLLLVASGEHPHSVISDLPSVSPSTVDGDPELLIEQEHSEILNPETGSSNQKKPEIVTAFSESFKALDDEGGETECGYEPDWNLSLQTGMEAVERELEAVIAWRTRNPPDTATASISAWPTPHDSNLSLPCLRPPSLPTEAEPVEEKEKELSGFPQPSTGNDDEDELEFDEEIILEEGISFVPEPLGASDDRQTVKEVEEQHPALLEPFTTNGDEEGAELDEESATVPAPSDDSYHEQEIKLEEGITSVPESLGVSDHEQAVKEVEEQHSALPEPVTACGIEEPATILEPLGASDHEQAVKEVEEQHSALPEPVTAYGDEEPVTVPEPFTVNYEQEAGLEKELPALPGPSPAEEDEDLKIISMEELEVYSVSSGSSIRSFGDFVEPSIGANQSFSSVSCVSAKDTPHFPIIDDVISAYEASLTSSSTDSCHSTGEKDPEALINTDDDWDGENDSGLNSPATSVSVNSIPNEDVNELDLNKQLPSETRLPLQLVEIQIPEVINVQPPPTKALIIQKQPKIALTTSSRNCSPCSSTTSSSRSKRPPRKNNGWKRIPKKQRLSPSSKQRFISRAFW